MQNQKCHVLLSAGLSGGAGYTQLLVASLAELPGKIWNTHKESLGVD